MESKSIKKKDNVWRRAKIHKNRQYFMGEKKNKGTEKYMKEYLRWTERNDGILMTDW